MKYVLITPARNEGPFIEKTLSSMVAQTVLPERWVIVDDGSTDNTGYDSSKDSFEGEHHVAGGCQLFRRRCFDEIGGFVPNRVGGVDWVAVTTARMKGWKTRSFPEKRFHHYRPLGTAERNVVGSLFSYGQKDYYLGGSPTWELFRVMYRMLKPPILVGGLALLAGYCWAGLRRVKRPVSRELMHFHRHEQMQKLAAIFSAVLRFKKVDSFRVITVQNRGNL